MGKDKCKQQDGETATSAKSITSPWDACQTNREAALAKTMAEAVVREMAKDHAHYQALLNERSSAVIPTSLKVTS